MFFEIFSDMINNISPFYMYIGVLWSAAGALQLINMNLHTFSREHHIYIRHSYNFEVNSALMEKPNVRNMEIKTWLIQKLKQIDAPDDDSDILNFSDLYQITQIRGGQFWIRNLYSRSLKNIA